MSEESKPGTVEGEDRLLSISRYDYDDELIELFRATRKAQLGVSCPERTMVVLGRGSQVQQEVFLDSIQHDGVSFLRRDGGGCAVVLDPGNVIVSAVVPLEKRGDVRRLLDRFSAWLLGGLCEIGIEGISVQGISDLTSKDRKFAGSSLRILRDAAYFSACLLVQPDLSSIERYLPHPPREPDYRNGRSHADFLTSLFELNHDWTTAAVCGALSENLTAPEA